VRVAGEPGLELARQALARGLQLLGVDPARRSEQLHLAHRLELVQQALGLGPRALDLDRQALRAVRAQACARQHDLERLARRLDPVRGARELGHDEALEALEPVLGLLEHDAAAQRDRGRGQAQHVAVAGRAHHGLLEAQLHQPARSGLEPLGVEQHDLPHHLGRAGVQPDRHAVLDRAVEAGEHGQLRPDHRHRPEEARRRGDVAAHDLVRVDLGQVERAGVPGARALGALLVGLDAAHLALLAARQHLDHVADLHRAADRNAGDDRAEAVRAEHALDRHAEHARVRARLGLGRQAEQLALEVLQALSGDRGQRHDRCALEEGARQRGAHVLQRQLDQRRLDHVDLGQRHQPALHAQDAHDGQVLARLRHDPVVGRDHQHDQVDAGRAGDHVLDEALVPGDVDDADLAAVGQREAREAQVDRHAALLLLLQPVGVDAGQGLDQRRLAVVDVAGGTDDDGLDLHAGGAAG
jgi:hypothetical protein